MFGQKSANVAEYETQPFIHENNLFLGKKLIDNRDSYEQNGYDYSKSKYHKLDTPLRMIGGLTEGPT